MNHQLEASFSTLVMSLASAAAVNMGLTPNPENNKTEKNLDLAQFNIDLLVTLKNKTKNNLETDEQQLVDAVISDLQMKYIQVKK